VKLLEIQSSPRGESSDSISLTKSFIEACKSDNTSIVVDTLNVWHERLAVRLTARYCNRSQDLSGNNGSRCKFVIRSSSMSPR
jgi:FMN-dependent NADH-azoreductase